MHVNKQRDVGSMKGAICNAIVVRSMQNTRELRFVPQIYAKSNFDSAQC
jgi:hypothetical protein